MEICVHAEFSTAQDSPGALSLLNFWGVRSIQPEKLATENSCEPFWGRAYISLDAEVGNQYFPGIIVDEDFS